MLTFTIILSNEEKIKLMSRNVFLAIPKKVLCGKLSPLWMPLICLSSKRGSKPDLQLSRLFIYFFSTHILGIE